jgi:predicted Zn-dependent peptidase
VGDIGADEVAHQLEAAFSTWAATRSDGDGVSKLVIDGLNASDLLPPGARGGGGVPTIYLVDKPGAAQSVISAGLLTVDRLDPDYLPLVVMNMAFGGQFTARLNMNLREDKGYTYGYRSHFDWHLERSSFLAGGSVQTAVTKEAIVETLKEFRDLRGDRPLSADEFEKARLGLIRGFPPTFETPGQVLGRLVDLVHYGLSDDYYTGLIERLQEVTLADVHRVAAEHIDPNALSIVVVGDRATIESGLAELDLPIVHLDYEGEAVE